MITTLITSFRYPRHGPGMLWDAAAARVRQQGGRIHMGTRVEGLRRDDDGGWRVQLWGPDGPLPPQAVDRVISSAPLGWLVNRIEPALPEAARAAATALRYRDFLLVALILRPRLSFPGNWLYIHDPKMRVGRIQNFANWSAEMVPDPQMACYGMEYFCDHTDPLWNSGDSELIRMATQELIQLGLARSGDVSDGAVVRQARAYPVYDRCYAERRAIIRSALESHCPGLHVVGRNGMHQYNNQDHSMMTAMRTVRNILAGRELYDVWQVDLDAHDPEPQPADAST